MTAIQERDFLYTTIEGIYHYVCTSSHETVAMEKVIPEVKAKLAYAEKTKERFLALHHDINKKAKPKEVEDSEATILRDFLKMCSAIELQLTEIVIQHELISPKTEPKMTENSTSLSQLVEVMTKTLESQSKPKKHLKLPALEIPQFSGEFKDWQEFHDMFVSTIHSNEDLRPVEKFKYLKSHLVGHAASAIKNFPVTDVNYSEAWDYLVNRYNKPKNIVFDHIKTFINSAKRNVGNPNDLRQLTTVLVETVRALDAMKKSQRDPWLIYITMEALDAESKNLWSREPLQGDVPTWTEFIDFLEQRYDSWSSCWDKKQDNKLVKGSSTSGKQISAQKPSHSKSTLSSLVTTVNGGGKCYICAGEDHFIATCRQFMGAQPQQRLKLANSAQLCLNCLRPGHQDQQCRGGKCRQCSGRHNTLLHESLSTDSQDKTTVPESKGKSSSSSLISATELIMRGPHQNLLPSVQLQVSGRGGVRHQCRALLDSCSQSNTMTRRLAEKLDIPMVNSTVSSIKGLGSIPMNAPRALTTEVHSRDNTVSMVLDFLVIDHITDEQPASTVKMAHGVPQNITLADPDYYKPGDIDILLGADVFMRVLRSRQITGSPMLQETSFGFIVAGSCNVDAPTGLVSFVTNCTCLLTELEPLSSQIGRFWNVEKVQNSRPLTAEETKCEEHFRLTTTRDAQGRFKVRLPTHDDLETLGESRSMAMRRFLCTERRLQRDEGLYSHYRQFMKQYEELGHMREMPPDYQSPMPEVYLAHHPVVKESTTTPVRVVFDASARTSTGRSLNSVLMVGPKVQDDIFDILIRYRQHNIVLRADIQKMYRQIRVHEDDQSMQRILWRESSREPIKTYLLETVTYGTACAPFLAIRCLQQLSVEEEQKFPLAAVTARRDFYVDDVLTGSSDVTTAQELQQQLHNMLQSGGFMLKKWASNSAEALQHVPVDDQETSSSLDLDSEGTIKTLGMHWNSFTDEFRFTTTEFNSSITKRSILSDMARIYDPLGLLAAVTISAKVLLQSLWKVKMDWDTELSSGIQKRWQQYQVNVYSVVSQITIPRQFTSFQSVSEVQLIAFCAASDEAFAASVYVCTVDNQGQRCSRLLCAKTKVAPLKEMSKSRLHLCSAVLLANLLKKVQSALSVQVKEIFAFTSSMLVLNWVSEDPSLWQTFVKNRVVVIQSVVSSSQWHFVAPQENPAELAARGVQAGELTKHSIWWQGPTWIADSEINPQPVDIAQVDLKELEMRSSVVLVSAQNSFWEITSRFSSYLKLIRCIAHWNRYVHNLYAKCKKIDGISGQLSPREVKEAETTLLRHIQAESYPEELKSLHAGNSVSRQSRILNLNPFIDNNGIMRVGGRISHASVSYEHKFPVILPQSHGVTEMIVRETHKNLLHGGAQLTLAHLRQSFWPVRGLDICKRVIRQCVTCFKVKPVPMKHLMSDCHPSRVTAVHAFYQTGVDYCGPVYIRTPVRSKTMLKMYIALYICLSTRAIHIELVSDLTTDAFIASLKRFVSRRGKPAEILCDNATNFVGAARELKEMVKLVESEEHQREVTDSASKQGIDFKFIPPRSPHFGGSWESTIKRIKYHLQRTVGNSHLTQEEMLTVLARIESCVNSRPLTPMSSDPTDMEVLTPGHFLIGRPLTALAEQNLLEVPEGRLKKWKLVDQRIQHFWHRWTSEYLHTLQQRRKWTSQHSPIAIGDMVIIKEDNLPPLKWNMGRVIQVHPGADGVTRVATVRTAYGTYKRAVAKLCLLPFTQ